jgi:heptosyltransferase-1
LIVRVGAMGDVLHAMPAVAALRRAHPDWFIGWVIEPRWAPLLRAFGDGIYPVEQRAAMPLVDRVYLAATREWKERPFSRSTIGDIALLRRELRDGQFDVCVDMQGSVRSAVIGRMAKALRLVGPAEPREAPAGWLYQEQVATGGTHVVEQGCELLGGGVGETLRPARVELPVDQIGEETCAELLGRTLGAEEKFVLIAPGAGWGAKQWPAKRYGAVAAALGRRGYRVLVSASVAEDATAEAVRSSSEGFAAVFPCDLRQLIALTRRATLVIAGDTGPLHLAAALERPVVALFGPTDPARNGPYGTRSRVLRHGPERRDHRRLQEPEAGLLEITVDEVTNAATDLLADEGS